MGEIRLLLGPMFSGKTSELLFCGESFEEEGKKVMYVNYKTGSMLTHDDKESKCTNVDNLSSLLTSDYDVFCIDEGQFFDDILMCSKLADNGKQVVVAALDGDYKQEPFKEILKLIPLSEHVTKLRAKCDSCEDKSYENAAFSIRTSDETDLVVLGGKDKYKAVCRKCMNVWKNKDVVN